MTAHAEFTSGHRVFDVAVAGAGLVVLFPLFALIAIAVGLSSKGPVLFRARRVGLHGRPFDVLKFRTMRVGADTSGPAITRAGDPRVTGVGRLLRRTKLDELPQLLNVIRGEMSIVGPRPEDPRYVSGYTATERAVLTVRPGITSAASTRYRHEEQLLARPDWERFYRETLLPDKLRIELDYLTRRTLWSDLRIMYATFVSVASVEPILEAHDGGVWLHREWVAVAAMAPFLLFPTRFPTLTWVALAVPPVMWLARMVTSRGAVVRTPLLLPTALLSVMVVVGLAISPTWSLAWPKFAGVVLGVATLRALLLSVRSRGRLQATVGVYLAVGAVFVGAGLLGTSLNNKFLPAAITSRVPQRIIDLAGPAGGVNPNALGATTLFFLPLAAALTFGRRRREAAAADQVAPLLRIVSVCSLILCALILLLSQSRTSWISCAGALVAISAVRWRAARWVVALVAVAVVIGVAVQVGRLDAPGPFAAVAMAPAAAGASLSLELRADIWSRAVDAIGDFPLTGVGLNAFRQVVPVMYPLTLVARDVDIAHAHNVFLQTALDVGIPGLIAYVALLMIATLMCWQIYRDGDPLAQRLALGLWGNLVAIHLFGLTDAVALGAKIGLFLWWSLGMIAALHQLTIASAGRKAAG